MRIDRAAGQSPGCGAAAMAHEQHLIVVQDKRTHAEERRTRDAPEQIARCVGDAIEQCQRSVCQALLHITVVQ